MFVVHACWLPGRMHGGTAEPGRVGIWGEDSSAPAELPRKPGRRPRVPAHPFAAAHEDLVAILPSAVLKATASTLTLTVPTRGGGPIASPELVRDQLDAATGEVSSGQWQVPALEFDADLALAVLDPNTEDAVWGTSITHLSELSRFAADLVARGRLLPGVVVDGPRAVWRPVLTAADAAWARTLAVSAPPPLFAAAPDTGLDLWAEALDCMVDAAARAALGGSRLTLGRAGDPVTRAWLSALTGIERVFAADPPAVAMLSEALAQWQRDAVAGPVRACFRLVEPADGDEEWQVRFGLQAADEPSLVVDAEAVWRSRGKLPALARQIVAPQETFLAELGKAARLYPELDRALRTARPSNLALDTEGAHGFLSTAAPTLGVAGFGVQLPGWWTKPSSRLGLRLTASTPGQPGRVDGGNAPLGFGAVAEFRYHIAVGDQGLTADELAELAETEGAAGAAARPVGRAGRTPASRRAQAGRASRAGHSESSCCVSASASALPRRACRSRASRPTAGSASCCPGGPSRGSRRSRRRSRSPGTLRPYQPRGLSWLDFLDRAGLGGVLADDMGLGKTVQLLALLAHDADAGPSLLVCPMSLVGNWQREAARFTPHLRVHVHHGTERARGKRFTDAVAAADLVVTTYALAARDAADLRKISWHRVVVDEAQAIKNAATRQATAVRSLPAGYRVAVTGTPVENRLADLWSIMEFANPGLLGPAAAFKKRYAEPIERHGDDDAAERLRRITGPFVLRRVKTDTSIIADLPDKLEMEVVCNLTAEQASLYQAVVDDMLERIEATATASSGAASCWPP